MFPHQNDNSTEADLGGDASFGGKAGGPPAADAMFESFLNDGLDELAETSTDSRVTHDEDVLAAGLHFFERMKGA